MPNLRIPGLTVVVVQGDQVILSRGYGVADRAAGTPMTEDTPVAIASTSKGMTALAIMQLVEQGLVDLDALVTLRAQFTMNDPRPDITVRQVLTYRWDPVGGFTDRGQDGQALMSDRRLASIGLHFAPGGGYEYANDGYSIARPDRAARVGAPYEGTSLRTVRATGMGAVRSISPQLSGDWRVTARAGVKSVLDRCRSRAAATRLVACSLQGVTWVTIWWPC
jgi:CubicO group peptidase (beta-lactamase class C family)